MKKLLFTLCSLFGVICICAQSNVSTPMNFHIEKELVPPILSIVPGTLHLVDPSNNNVIDGGETCKICFEVANTGRGDAFGCIAHISAVGSKEGLIIKDMPLPVIESGKKRLIEIPIEATSRTQTGEVALTLVVNEPNGYGTDEIHYTIGTHRQRTPLVQIADSKVVGEKGGKLGRNEIFTLQVVVQNTDQGVAEGVNINLVRPANVNWQGGTPEHFTIGTLRPNEKRVLEYELIANKLAEENLNIHFNITERTGQYARNADIPLQLGQYIGSSIAVNVERHDEEVEIQKASLVSDVDTNIPVTGIKNTNTFVLIIANEHYQQVASVPFALNDGNIFREYCIKTLGINEKHIHYLADATGFQIKAEIDKWLAPVIETFDNPQVIVYYAGHGIPDEASKSAYLLPVDGYGTDASTGYKLDELYNTLGNMPASQITIFMDACFSGSKREQGMLASARGVALKVKSGEPRGNMVVFSAAQGDETAYPDREQQHGLFTYFLLKKLQETKGEVSLKELGDYITQNVSRQSLILNSKKQTPSVRPSVTVVGEWQNWKLK